ncbi:Serine proteases trypsin domain [Trinorchestia longiramus]|nr:Serine proteases trypsin domain [Trinorchestia longiramus]
MIIVVRMLTVWAVVAGCAHALVRPSRIVNGEPVPQGDAQWQVSIQSRMGSHHFCGGTLISPTWVVTAAHCTLASRYVVHVNEVQAYKIKIS